MSQPKSQNIQWHGANITKEERSTLLDAKGAVVWFTGLSGSGKSTIARCVEHLLLQRHIPTYVLDGDNIRFGLNKDLGFSPADRTENIRRIGEVAKLFADGSVVTLTAFISPYRADRDQVRAIMPAGEFIEVFIDTPLDVCEQRDPKGLYKKARAGKIPEFTGITSAYDAPEKPELTLDANTKSIDDLAREVVAYLEKNGYFKS